MQNRFLFRAGPRPGTGTTATRISRALRCQATISALACTLAAPALAQSNGCSLLNGATGTLTSQNSVEWYGAFTGGTTIKVRAYLVSGTSQTAQLALLDGYNLQTVAVTNQSVPTTLSLTIPAQNSVGGNTWKVYFRGAVFGTDRVIAYQAACGDFPPIQITAPGARTLTLNPSACAIPGPLPLGSPTVTGSFGPTTVSNNAPSTYPLGPTDVTWSVSSLFGSDTDTQIVTVRDLTPPVLACPSNVQVNNASGLCGANVTVAASAADNCSGSLAAVGTRGDGLALDALYPVGTTTITWVATDASGNRSTCTQKVTVIDAEMPTIGTGSNLTANTTPGQCTASVSFTPPTASDNCGTPPVVCKVGSTPITSPHTFPVGVTTVNCTATDAAGNTASSSVTVTVSDNQRPTVDCPPLVSVPVDSGTCAATGVSLGTPTTNDNCGVAGVTNNAPTTFPVGDTTVTWTVIDIHGNTATCQQTVRVTAPAPSLSCSPTITATTDAGQCSASGLNPSAPSATGGCGTVNVTGTRSDNQPLNAPYPVGNTTINWTATDANGNQASCQQMVTVTDDEEPTIECPANKGVRNDPNRCDATVPLDIPEALDNCGAPNAVGTRSDGKPLSDPYPLGQTTITWTATDEAGNSASCSQVVTVSDRDAPSISGVSATPNRLWPPNHQMVDVTVNYTTLDLCGAVTSSLSVTSSEPDSGLGDGDLPNDIEIIDNHRVRLRAERANGRTHTITITCTDASGNTRTATTSVVVPKSSTGR